MMVRPAVGAGMIFALVAAAGANAASAAVDPRTTESRITAWQNDDRIARGIEPLRSSATLIRIARAHAERMAAAHSVWHQSDLADVVPPWTELGDNIGRGPSNEEIYGEFRASEWHQRNIVDPAFELTGVGAAVADDDTLYVAVIFLAPEKPVAKPRRSEPFRQLAAAAQRFVAPPRHIVPLSMPSESVTMVVELASIIEGETGLGSRLIRERAVG